MTKRIIVTGGLGYIGSFTTLALLREGYDVLVVDNLSNSDVNVKSAIEKLAGRSFLFENIDICNYQKLLKIFLNFNPEHVIHFAGLKSVIESMSEPEEYFKVNVGGTSNLIDACLVSGCKDIVFSSSCTVYEPNHTGIFTEQSKLGPISHYGTTKLCAEMLLTTSAKLFGNKLISLRYFNPAGAHVSGDLGEWPIKDYKNLFHLIATQSLQLNDEFSIYGNDFNTKDGTAVRDYIHVEDVAIAHLKALKKLQGLPVNSFECINIGTGKATSVLDIIRTFETITDRKINIKFEKRRDCEMPVAITNSNYGNKFLSWDPRHDLTDMVTDAWNWYTTHPEGFKN